MTKFEKVLNALGDVIRSQYHGVDHEPTPSEYFALVTKVMAPGGEAGPHLLHMLRVLEGVAPAASRDLVREQFRALSSALARMLTLKNDELVSRVISVLGSVVLMQETSDGFWSSPHSLHTINIFLNLLDSSDFHRKLVIKQLTALLQVHHKQRAKALFGYLTDFSLLLMKSATKSEYKRSFHLLFLLESCIGYFPNHLILSLFESILRLQTCDQPILTANIFRTIDSLYQNPNTSLTSAQINRTIQMLIKFRPSTLDMESNSLYFSCLCDGMILFHKLDPNSSYSHLEVIMKILISGHQSDFTQVHISSCMAMKRILTVFIDQNFVERVTDFGNLNASKSSNVDQIQSSQESSIVTIFSQVIRDITHLLDLKYQNAWISSLDVIRCLFDKITKQNALLLLKSIMVAVADLNQGIESCVIQVDTERAYLISNILGAILKSTGMRYFLEVIPFQIGETPKLFGIDPSREWILNLLNTHLKSIPNKLEDFQTFIITTINMCKQSIEFSYQHNLTPFDISLLRTRISQLWSIFPTICFTCPSDIMSAFPSLTPTLQSYLGDVGYPEVKHHIVIGLTHLAKGVLEKNRQPTFTLMKVPSDYMTLKQHSAQFIPVLLTSLESLDITDNNYPALLQCLTVWSGIASVELVISCAKKLLKLLLTNSSSLISQKNNESINKNNLSALMDVPENGSKYHLDSTAAGWIAVMQAIIPHLPESVVLLIYKAIRPFLSNTESVSLQKRAYHLLETLLKYHSKTLNTIETNMTMFRVMMNSFPTLHVSARNMRLRCLEVLVEKLKREELTEASTSLMGEILSCLKDSNKKSRDLSLNLLKYLVCQLPTEDSLLLLGSAIVGETASLRVGGVTGLCILLLEKRSDMSLLSQVISALDTVCYLLKNESVEESRAVLSFLRVCANVLPSNLLIPILPKFVPTVTSGLGILKPKFTSRIRAIMRKLIQKCGESSIRPCVTEIDIPLFDYIVKQSRRVKKKKHQKLAYEKSQLDKMLGSDSEDSEDNNKDDEDMVDSHRRTRVRAKRPIDYILHMPHSLQEFVEGAEGPSGPDERYSVKVSAEGKVVVCETDVHEEVHADVEERHENERSRERVSFSGGKKPRTREPGAEYRSARAGGDVWRKGMLEPHAYIPLEPKLLNKKRRHEALGTFASVVKNRNKTGKKSKAPRFVKNMKLSKKK